MRWAVATEPLHRSTRGPLQGRYENVGYADNIYDQKIGVNMTFGGGKTFVLQGVQFLKRDKITGGYLFLFFLLFGEWTQVRNPFGQSDRIDFICPDQGHTVFKSFCFNKGVS